MINGPVKAFLLGLAAAPLLAQAVPAPQPPWDDQARISIPGSVHPRLARLEPLGPVSPDLPLEHMILVLKPSPEAQSRLGRLLRDQQDPASPRYHQWLTPEQFGALFGPGKAQLDSATTWLAQQGFTVDGPARGGLSISFSGTAAQAGKAFRTAIVEYDVDGVRRHGNATGISLPKGLAGFASGVVSLNDMPRQTYCVNHGPLARPGPARPELDTTMGNAVGAGDFAAIYDLNPLFTAAAPITGTGVTIAVVGETNLTTADQTLFRTSFNLTQYGGDFAVVTPAADPGILTDGEELEADVDTQWSAAAAPGAHVRLVLFPSSLTTQGVDRSAQYIVDNLYAPIITMSYGACESALGAAGNDFYNQLWEQAASEGISVFVAAGDSGAAGCDDSDETQATGGRAVSGIASTPFDTCVGGTMFSGDAANDPNTYWNANAGSNLYLATARSYIPEAAWNESAVTGSLAAGGGGASTIYPRPAWQAAYGVPATPFMRLLPDVAFNAAVEHDPYLVIQDDTPYAVGGTSVAAPAMAGIMALVVQKTGQWQGNPNLTLYSLAKAQYDNLYGSGPAAPPVFHDVTSGSNTVPGVNGFYAGNGYDEATGLGSLDAAVLVSNWVKAADPIVVTPLPATLTVPSGQPAHFSGSATETGNPALTYSWSFGDGATATGASASHAYTITGNQPRVFQATLTVSDGTNVQASSEQVTVTPPSPVAAAIVLPVTSVSVLPGIAIAFAATAQSPGATIASYAWTFGDGGSASGATASHSFADSANGFYTVTLTATDGNGNVGTASVQVYADASVMDVAGNGTVDVRDLLVIAGAWNPSLVATPANFNGLNFAADLNGGNSITDTDLTLWITDFEEVIQ